MTPEIVIITAGLIGISYLINRIRDRREGRPHEDVGILRRHQEATEKNAIMKSLRRS